MTKKVTNGKADLETLGQVLDRYGSDRTRWPAPVRRDFAGLLSTSAEAQGRLREAEALDRLLDLAPAPVIDTRALTDRILAAAAAEKPAAAPPSRPRPWSVFSRRTAGANEPQSPAASLLAASLVLGAVFGMSGTFDRTVEGLMTANATTLETEIDPGRIAFDSDALSLFEEDTL